MNSLYIDTRDNKKIIVKVIKGKEEFVLESTPEYARADIVLKLIQDGLEKAGITLQDLNHIYCEKGPGSFTGLRVGFAIANALSLALLIPVNNNEIGSMDKPVYS